MIEESRYSGAKMAAAGVYAGGYVNEEPKLTQKVSTDSIGDEVGRLRDCITQLHELATVLEQKLAPVRNILPTPCENEKAPFRDGSELREALREQNGRLSALRERMLGLHREIDL